MSYTIPNKALLSQLTASSHVSASAFYGDGSNLTNIAAGGLTSVATGGNITGSGISGNPIGVKPDPQFNTVTASVVTASDIITDYVNFNSNTDPSWDNGRMWYNNTTHELNYWTEVDGFNIKIGQQLVQRCKNDQGSPLIKGSVVHITGSISSADTPMVRLADWTNDGLSANTLGLVADDIDTGGEGYVIVQGILKGYNTNGYAPGEMLYLSSSGQITNIKPSTPKHTVSVGQVVRKQIESGSIYVSIQNGYEIGELHDVLTNGKATGDLLVWDSSIPAWKNSATLSGSYIISGSQTVTGSLIATNSITSSNGISGRLYGTASYALDADLFDGQNSSLFALKTDVSGAVTGGLAPYATLTGVSASFTTPTQVSGAITGALSPYALSSALSSSFVTNTAATASLAFLTASNTFTSNNNFTGQVTASSLLVDGNTLFVDSINNRVGIGTITPTATMSVGPNPDASLNANEMLQLAKTTDCFMTIRNGTSTLYLGSNANESYIGTYTNTNFKLAQNGLDALIINASASFRKSVVPAVDNTYTLGNGSYRWSSVSTLDMYTQKAWIATGTGQYSGEIYLGNYLFDTAGGMGLTHRRWRIKNLDYLVFQYGDSLNSTFTTSGFLNDDTTANQIDFTGQHRCQTNDITNIDTLIGLIVSSTGEYSDSLDNLDTKININEAIPKINLSNTRNDKKVFGVISDKEDTESREYSTGRFVSVYPKNSEDDRIIVNSLGEGGIWVTNINGNLENGDYITSCEIPGYGMKQDDDLLHNYTVAKITCDCDFNLNSTVYKCEEFEFNGMTYKKAFVGCTYHCG